VAAAGAAAGAGAGAGVGAGVGAVAGAGVAAGVAAGAGAGAGAGLAVGVAVEVVAAMVTAVAYCFGSGSEAGVGGGPRLPPPKWRRTRSRCLRLWRHQPRRAFAPPVRVARSPPV